MFKGSLLTMGFLALIQGFSLGSSANVSEFQANQLTEKLEAQKRASTETIVKLLVEIRKLKAGVSSSTADDALDVSKSHNNNDQRTFNELFRVNYGDSFDHCHPDDQVRCVQRCTSRWSDGSCRGSAPDYCGRNARCAENCRQRWSDGSCREYDADFCGPDANCAVNCTSRWSDGSCSDYGPDICY